MAADPQQAASKPTYEELEAQVVAQSLIIAELREQNAELKERIDELERRLEMNSRNSSKPPSSDGYNKPKAKRSLRRRSGRKPGGQPGSKGHKLDQVANPDEIMEHRPDTCPSCSADLQDADPIDYEPRQVFDLPAPRLKVVEHRSLKLRCRTCGSTAKGCFPNEVNTATQYGPNIRAFVAYLCIFQHLPYARAAKLIYDMTGTDISTGTLVNIVKATADGLDQFGRELRDQLADAKVAHFDETGARVDGCLNWVHSASNGQLTYYDLHPKRGKEAMDDIGILPNFNGVAVHDGWGSYRRYQDLTHALCSAHHLRELEAIGEHKGQEWATDMQDLLFELKDRVDRARDLGLPSLSKELLGGCVRRYREIIKAGHMANPPPKCKQGKRGRPKRSKALNLLLRLEEYEEDALRFAFDFDVPFDNNLAERDIRMVKLQQKISGCWRTVAGAKAFLSIRSYVSTAVKQNQDVLYVLRLAAENRPWMPGGGDGGE